MIRVFCVVATLATATIAFLPLAPKVARATECYLITADGWRIDLSNLCEKSEVPTTYPATYARSEWGLSLDLPSYCQQKYGVNAAAILQENSATGWKCFVDGQTQEISFAEACSLRYGPFTRPVMGDINDINSWHCRRHSDVAYQASGS